MQLMLLCSFVGLPNSELDSSSPMRRICTGSMTNSSSFSSPAPRGQPGAESGDPELTRLQMMQFEANVLLETSAQPGNDDSDFIETSDEPCDPDDGLECPPARTQDPGGDAWRAMPKASNAATVADSVADEAEAMAEKARKAALAKPTSTLPMDEWELPGTSELKKHSSQHKSKQMKKAHRSLKKSQHSAHKKAHKAGGKLHN